jgi:hypothetical protein
MPSRFISLTTAFPKLERPPQIRPASGELQVSADLGTEFFDQASFDAGVKVAGCQLRRKTGGVELVDFAKNAEQPGPDIPREDPTFRQHRDMGHVDLRHGGEVSRPDLSQGPVEIANKFLSGTAAQPGAFSDCGETSRFRGRCQASLLCFR